jgi:hypothetical protein
MRDPEIAQAHEPEHDIEVIPGDSRAIDGVRNPRVSENNHTKVGITELKQEVCRLAERAKNLLGRTDFDFDFDEEELSSDPLAALAQVEAQSEWKMPERFDMPRCEATPVCRETRSVKNIHEVLREKEQEAATLQDEIEALRRVLPLLSDSQDRTANLTWLSRSCQPMRIP